jgi:LPXTG-motif cell wall-anchored protein
MERDHMFYVIIIVIAVLLAGGLYLVRGRRSA